MVAPLWGDPNQTHVGGLPYGIPLPLSGRSGPANLRLYGLLRFAPNQARL